MEWQIKIGDTDYKAESIETVRRWVAEGRVQADSYVFHPVLQKWMYAKDLEELRGVQFVRGTAAPQSPPTPKKTSACSVLVAFVLLGFLAILVIGLLAGHEGGRTGPAHSSQISSGAGVLRAPTGSSHVVVATTEDTLDEMTRAGNDRAIAALILGGKGFLVPQGTGVSVIGSGGLGKRKIVVTEGEMTGRSGWVPMEWVVAR